MVVATTVYTLAMRDEAIPRFTADAMPKPEPETPATPPPAQPARPATSR